MATNRYPDLQRLFGTHALTDVTIRCGKESFKAHAIILASASKYFEKALSGEFESKTRIIDMDEEQPRLIQVLLRWIYGFPYEATTSQSPFNGKTINALMYAIADKYDVAGLKQEAEDSFQKSLCLEKYSSAEFSDLVKVVYGETPSTDRGLRDKLVQPLRSQPKLLQTWPRETMDIIFMDNEGFAFDLLENAGALKTYQCPSCHHHVKLEVYDRNTYCPRCGSCQTAASWAKYETAK